MKILFVSSALDFDNSSASHRNRLLLQRLAAFHTVDSLEIVGNKKRYFTSPVRRELQVVLSGYREQVNSNSVKSKFIYLKRFLKYLIPDKLVVSLLFKNLNLSHNLDMEYDYIILSSDPKGIFSILFNNNFKKISNNSKIIQYWGDPLVGDVNFKYFSFFHSLLERIYLSHADNVLFVSSATMQAKQKEYPNYINKFGYLPRCINFKLCNKNDNVKNKEVLNLLYSGEYHPNVRNINPLLKAVSNIQKTKLIVAGTGCNTQNIRSDNIFFLGRILKNDLESYVEKSDVIFVILNSRGTQIPGKIFDLVFSEKVVVVLYENKNIIEHIPFNSKFHFVKNCEKSISEFLNSSYDKKYISHEDFDAYDKKINSVLSDLFL